MRLEELSNHLVWLPTNPLRFFFPDRLVKVYSILAFETNDLFLFQSIKPQGNLSRRQFLSISEKPERFMPAFQLPWSFRQFAHLRTRKLMA